VNVMLRKIAVAAASKPAVEIKQEGDTFYIKTSTTVRTTEINFKVGEEFEEQTVDGRPCKSLVKWESENKMVCEQRLLKGEGPKTSWTRELTNDGELILTMTADDVVCTRVYVREHFRGSLGCLLQDLAFFDLFSPPLHQQRGKACKSPDHPFRVHSLPPQVSSPSPNPAPRVGSL
ncbi:Cellular retinoic acid-binding protein 2, partial [Saguinus oedipus]